MALRGILPHDGVFAFAFFNPGDPVGTSVAVRDCAYTLAGLGFHVFVVDAGQGYTTQIFMAVAPDDVHRMDVAFANSRHPEDEYAGLPGFEVPETGGLIKLLPCANDSTMHMQQSMSTTYKNVLDSRESVASTASADAKFFRVMMSRNAKASFPTVVNQPIICLVDCPGADDILAMTALISADSLIMPCEPTNRSRGGANFVLTRVLRNVEEYAGIVNRYADRRTIGVQHVRVPVLFGLIMRNLTRVNHGAVTAEEGASIRRHELVVEAYLLAKGLPGNGADFIVARLFKGGNTERISEQYNLPMFCIDPKLRTNDDKARIQRDRDSQEALARRVVEHVNARARIRVAGHHQLPQLPAPGNFTIHRSVVHRSADVVQQAARLAGAPIPGRKRPAGAPAPPTAAAAPPARGAGAAAAASPPARGAGAAAVPAPSTAARTSTTVPRPRVNSVQTRDAEAAAVRLHAEGRAAMLPGVPPVRKRKREDEVHEDDDTTTSTAPSAKRAPKAAP